ncbi:MAG: translation initiation factor IF-2 subunit gamma [Candidatus Micrarchaeia archaeon]
MTGSPQAVVNIGLLGHVDHGKTSLTKALTGKWTDTHSEEVKRGISIRLGYADTNIYFCPKCNLHTLKDKCPNCGGKTDIKRRVSFLDAPGHETLMTIVLSASSIMDGALLLIAANEPCPQPQTAEHLMILNIAGIKNVVVVQTKIDLVTKEQAKAHYESIRNFLKGSVAENAPIIPVVSNYGINVDAVADAIERSIPTPHRDSSLPPVMFISRSFDINKPGTPIPNLKGGVVGGSLVQGTIKKGDTVLIRPGFETSKKVVKEVQVKVESLMSEGGPLESAAPGGLIAVGTSLDPNVAKADSLVGCLLGKPGSLPDAKAEIIFDHHLIQREGFDNPPLKMGEPIVINVGTATGIGVIAAIKKGQVLAKLKKPVCVVKGSTVAMSRRVGQRWRLAGWGKSL